MHSPARAGGTRTEIAPAQGENPVGRAPPADAVVWYDLAYSGRAAASCCPAIAFFCSGAELQRWLSGQSPPRADNLLTLDEALEVGRALFEPVFAEAKPN